MNETHRIRWALNKWAQVGVKLIGILFIKIYIYCTCYWIRLFYDYWTFKAMSYSDKNLNI